MKGSTIQCSSGIISRMDRKSDICLWSWDRKWCEFEAVQSRNTVRLDFLHWTSFSIQLTAWVNRLSLVAFSQGSVIFIFPTPACAEPTFTTAGKVYPYLDRHGRNPIISSAGVFWWDTFATNKHCYWHSLTISHPGLSRIKVLEDEQKCCLGHPTNKRLSDVVNE